MALLVHCFQVELRFGMWFFSGGGKTRGPEKKLSGQGREPATNSTHMRRQVREPNPSHSGGRRALSPLPPPLLTTSRRSFCPFSHEQTLYKNRSRHFELIKTTVLCSSRAKAQQAINVCTWVTYRTLLF